MESNKKYRYISLKGYIVPIIMAFIASVFIIKFLIFNVYIPSSSMVPTINAGDKLMIKKVYNMGNIKRGDILVFYSDELQETLIKRLIGLPGDHIVIKDGIVNINGEDIKEDYVKNNDYNDEELVYDVPEEKYFFLGDNRPVSRDSRRWMNPYIDKDDIKGKLVLRFYPVKDFGSVN